MIHESSDLHLTNHKAYLVYFFHDQCPPCINLRPKEKNLIESKFPQIVLDFVDAIAFPAVASAHGVFTFPTLILYFEGKEFGRWSKYVSVAQLEEQIRRPYDFLFG